MTVNNMVMQDQKALVSIFYAVFQNVFIISYLAQIFKAGYYIKIVDK